MKYIYHYTSIRSLPDLLHTPNDIESNFIEDNGNNLDYGYYMDFHAGDINLMNDTLENKLVKNIFKKISYHLRSSAEYAQWIHGKLYAVSFSTESDYIPLWRIYAAENSGICLKFQYNAIEDAVKNINNNTFVNIQAGLCQYLSKTEFKNKLQIVLSEIASANNESSTSGWHKLNDAFVQSAFCKLRAFEYEKEYRLAAFVNSDCHIKQGKYGLSPYYPIKIPMRLLKEIIIGPSKYQDTLAYSIQELIKSRILDKLDNYDINIKVSKSHLKIR